MRKKISKKKAEEILRDVDSLYEDALSAGVGRSDAIYENLSFYVGMQHAVKDGVYVDLYDSPTGEAVEMFNICRPIVRAATATTLKQVINIEVPAMNGDHKARARADMAEKLCKAWVKNGVVDLDDLHKTIQYSKICGLGWMKVTWDPDAGRPVPRPEQNYEDLGEFADEAQDIDEVNESQEAETDMFGAEVESEIFEGEISTEFVRSTDLLFDPTIASYKDFRRRGAYVVHRKLHPVRYLEDLYPEDMFGDTTEGKWEVGRQKFDVNYDMRMDAYGSAEGKYSDKNIMAELCEFWQNPTSKFPNGLFVLFSGSLILEMGPNPYYHKKIPFVPLFGDNQVPNAFHPDGVLADIKSTQRTINRIKAKERELLDFLVSPRIFVPRASGIDPDSLDDLPRVIPFDRGFKPEIEHPPQIPESLMTYTDALSESAKYVAGYGESSVTGGDVSGASGRALSYHKELEEGLHSPELAYYRKFLTEVLQFCLCYARQFYDEGRVIKVAGDEGKWELMEFHPDDYDLEAELIPEVFSNGPTSPGEKFRETMELFGMGLFDPENPAAVTALKLLGDRYSTASTYDIKYVSKLKARRLLTTVTRNPTAPVNVYPWDEHETLLEEFNRYRMSVEYEELPPFLQQKIDALAEMSEQYLADQQMVQAQDQNMFAQMPGANNKGSQPVQPQAQSPMNGGWGPAQNDQMNQEKPMEEVAQQGLGPNAAPDPSALP